MNITRAARPIPIAVTALVAFAGALAALAVSNGHGAGSRQPASPGRRR